MESHLPLVHTLARRYAGQGEPLDELVQVGAVGLVKAGNRFDRNRGVAFATFATPVIEGEIRRHLRDRSAPMRIPRGEQRASGELRRQRTRLTATSGRNPSTAELGAALGIDAEHVERALRVELARESVPFADDEASVERHEGSDQQESSEERLSLARCMQALDERERKIVFLRFHADMTERQIASELEISQAHVSRLLAAALERLRTELAGANAGDSAADTTVQEVISPDLAAVGGAQVAVSAAHEAADEEHATPASRSRSEPPPTPRKSERRPAAEPEPGAKIAGVAASQGTLSIEHYLELPYTVAVHSEREGKEGEARWIATAEELPGCAAQGRTPDEAVELLRPAMESWLEAALAQRREIPVPSGRAAKKPAPSSHSGRFLVRMPGALHAQLASAAEREQLSLNRFVTNVLAGAVSGTKPAPSTGVERSPSEAGDPEQHPGTEPSRALRIALAINVALVVIAAAAAIVMLVLALQHGV